MGEPPEFREVKHGLSRPERDEKSAYEILSEIKNLLVQLVSVNQTLLQADIQPVIVPVFVGYPGVSPQFSPMPKKQLVVCPKCGKLGTINICSYNKGEKVYKYMKIYHGNGERCHIGLWSPKPGFDPRPPPHKNEALSDSGCNSCPFSEDSIT